MTFRSLLYNPNVSAKIGGVTDYFSTNKTISYKVSRLSGANPATQLAWCFPGLFIIEQYLSGRWQCLTLEVDKECLNQLTLNFHGYENQVKQE